MVLINSSAPKGICYVETKNLDGETNLKHKQAVIDSVDISKTDDDVLENFLASEIECDQPNEFLYSFTGKMIINEKEWPLDDS